jgi:acetyl-CoA C-acetyltransferase
MRDVVVAGVGQTKFGAEERGIRHVGAEAAHAAVVDAGINVRDVDAAFVGNVGGPADPQRGLVGQVCLREMGISGISVTNMENACSSSSAAFRQGYRAVAAGFEDVVLVLGVEKMTGVSTEEATESLGSSADAVREGQRGMAFTGAYAMSANAYREKYGSENFREALTRVSVKNHRNALGNPYAHFHREITPEDVLDSAMIAEPLRLYDMSPISDGAAAIVIAAEDTLPEPPETRITVEASVHRTGDYDDPDVDAADAHGTARAAAAAYEEAGLSAADIDLFEVHDGATFGELNHMEALGICDYGAAPSVVLAGETEVDGTFPVNPSGGLKGRGHPIGATGVAQLNEIVWQLRGEAGDRQVPDATVGLADNGGGSLNGVGANYTVHILRAGR